MIRSIVIDDERNCMKLEKIVQKEQKLFKL